MALIFVFLKLLSSPKAGLHLPYLPPYLWCLAGHQALLVNGRRGIHLEISHRRSAEREKGLREAGDSADGEERAA